ncbi:MAG: DUF1292 domain-containing protein, partial [Clostridia bacterium]
MLEEKDNISTLDEEIDADDGVIQLINEDGDTLDFFFVASLEYKNQWYAFFQPAEEMADIDDDEIVVFKIVEDANGDDTFEPIEDEKLLDEVYDEYVKMHKDYLTEKGLDIDECDCDDDCKC